MDNKLPTEEQNKAVRARFHGQKILKSKYTPLHPDSSEREMRRISNSYMKIVSKELKKILPEIIEAYDRELQGKTRQDGLFDLGKRIAESFFQASENIQKDTEDFGLGEKISKAAYGVKRSAVREWKRAVGKTLGIEVDEEYYKDEMFREAVEAWKQERIDTFKDIPADVLSLVRKKIEDGYRDGVPTSQIKKEIQHIYSTIRREIADSEAESVSYLGYKVSRKIQEDAGVTEYIWITRRDSRVRPCHAALDSKKMSWNNPPEMWYDTKSRGRVYTGKYCHPGEDYGCRCMASPVFNKETLNLPVG